MLRSEPSLPTTSCSVDNAPLGRVDGDTLQPFLDNALTAVAAGRAPPTPQTRPYGCTVKYGGS